MQHAQQHVIKKQTLEVTIPSKEQHHAVYEKVVRIYNQKITPELEKLFNRLIPSNQYIFIDKIEIDLGNIPANQLQQMLPELLIKEVQKQLQEKLQRIEYKNHPPDKHTNTQTNIPTSLETFIFFLRKGYFPWWTVATNISTFEQELRTVLSKEVIPVLESIFTEKYTLNRFTEQFSEQLFRQIYQLLQPETMKSLPPEKISISKRKILLKECLIDISKSPQSDKEITLDLNTNIFQLPQSNKEITPDLNANIPQHIQTNNQSDEEVIFNSNTNTPQPSQINNQPEKEGTPDSEEIAVEYYIQNAGIVILWSYLQRFFETLQLVQSGQFTDEMAQERAVHLLYFLATGHTQPEEPDTVIFKFLCGLELDFPIKKHLELSEKETTEAEHLLQSVIKHWKKLKNTSTDGLRQGFLQREGKLFYENNKWQLVVEQRGIDVLLNYLPWTLSMVKLPWREDILHVTWA